MPCQVLARVRLLSFSLNNRMRPRHAFALSYGVSLRHPMLTMDDNKFVDRLRHNGVAAVTLAEFLAFKQATTSRS